MDLTLFSEPLKTILLSAAGNLTARFIAASALKVQKQFSDEPRKEALNEAMTKALRATVGEISDDPEKIKHYVGIFSEWMQRESVTAELAQVIDPRLAAKPDIETLRSEFENSGYDWKWLGVNFESCLSRFIEEFKNDAAKQHNLQGLINIKLLQEIVDHLKILIDRTPAGPGLPLLQRNYLQRILNQCRLLSLIGIDKGSADATCNIKDRMGLADVYIQLDTTEKESRRQKGQRDILLTDDKDAKPLSAIKALASHSRCILLGIPGSGKSTFVNHLCMCLASHQTEPEGPWLEQLPGWPKKWSQLIPVPVVLREMAAWIQDRQPTEKLVALLTAYLKDWLTQKNLPDYFDYLRASLLGGKALLLLDGFDEVPVNEDLRKPLYDCMADLPAAFPDTPIMVTCRILSYQDPRWRLSENVWRKFELSPFSEEQIKEFITAWYLQLEARGSLSDAKGDPKKLIETVKRKDLAPLARNPLLLTAIVIVNIDEGELPDSRALLYKKVVDLLLWQWDNVRLQSSDGRRITAWRQLLKMAKNNITDNDVKTKIWKLAYDAHGKTAGGKGGEVTADIGGGTLRAALSELHKEKSLDWARELVNIMKERAGLLIPIREDVYCFPHRTFQEYLAGCHLGKMNNFAKEAAALAGQGNYWWEVILLAVGHLVHNNQDYDKPLNLVNELCLADVAAGTKEADWRNVWLAGKIFLEIGPTRAVGECKLGEELQLRLRRQLTELVKRGLLTPRERAEAANVLGELGDPRPGVGLKNGLPDIDWVPVEVGPFVMGSDKKQDSKARDDELPQFICTLIREPYRISRYPVTVAQYQAFVEAGGYKDQRYWTGAGWKWRTEKSFTGPQSTGKEVPSNHPQVGVSWYEAAAFCGWLAEILKHKVDLPTEAQWERAARHTDGRIFAWGNEFDASLCNMNETGIGGTSAVGIFPGGAAECGAMDMCGNVLEWCRTVYCDNYKDYQKKVSDDLEGTTARVVRGGAFDYDRDYVRSAYRYRFYPDDRLEYCGFRVVAPGL